MKKTKKVNKTASFDVEAAILALKDFFDEVTRPDTAFRRGRDGEPFTKYHIVCSALALLALSLIGANINKAQYRACEKGSNDYILRLAIAYCRAKRGIEGYWIDEKKVVHYPQRKVVKK